MLYCYVYLLEALRLVYSLCAVRQGKLYGEGRVSWRQRNMLRHWMHEYKENVTPIAADTMLIYGHVGKP